MNFREAEQHLNARQMFGVKLGLHNIRRLLRRLDNPEKTFKSIHIAGTNGKGSTAAFLASILTENDIKTGLYTSPHISTVRERFRIDGNKISTRDFTRIYEKIKNHDQDIPLTYFECTTALAFLWFAAQGVEAAVIEVGLGGRLDATNVITPLCSVITSIAYDHQEHLGSTLEQITREKCGIIKTQAPVISAVKQPQCKKIIQSYANKKNAPYYEAQKNVRIYNVVSNLSGSTFDAQYKNRSHKNIHIPLIGKFQVENARTALAAAEKINTDSKQLDDKKIKNGLRKVKWPERLTLYARKKTVIIDVAHNEQGFFTLKRELLRYFPCKNVLLVIGMKGEKDWEQALSKIIPICRTVIGIPLPRSQGLQKRQLAQFLRPKNIPFTYFASVKGGIRFAYKTAGQNDIIVCAGSHYTVAQIKKVLNSLD